MTTPSKSNLPINGTFYRMHIHGLVHPKGISDGQGTTPYTLIQIQQTVGRGILTPDNPTYT